MNPQITLESLARRVVALEQALKLRDLDSPPKDWRNVVGTFRDSEFMRDVDEECRRAREDEREEARREDSHT